jgi:hypothetical protein
MLRAQGVTCDSFTVSESPSEQADSQYFQAVALDDRVRDIVRSLPPHAYKSVVVFCNSLPRRSKFRPFA